ncbi:hypothetical protein [Stieleria neptunia]|uniref:hypothetical protein n=1 Tax=Stieleria neptunia TaxID=2527979 RepID=UPI0011A91C3E|nr:hypothetical protein [Stieleria neptunia]
MFVRWLRCDRRLRKTFRESVRIYLRTYGVYIAARYWFKKSKPGCIILSNDHVGTYCALNKAAQDEGVPTVYIQHACVADHFPALKFDYAFLDGRDAFDKYGPSTKTKVFLTGIAKYDHTFRAKDLTRPKDGEQQSSIGICFNLLDDFEYTRTVLSQLRSDFVSREILVRLHPATPPAIFDAVRRLCEDMNLCMSEAAVEDSFAFLERVGILVCGASSIALEAALMGVPSVVYFSSETEDVYGFVKHGLSRHARSLERIAAEIVDLDRQPRSVLAEKAEYFCAGCSRPDRPPSAALAADLISRICDSEEPLGWERTDDGHYEWNAGNRNR